MFRNHRNNVLWFGGRRLFPAKKDSIDTDKMEDKRHEKSWYFYGRRMRRD